MSTPFKRGDTWFITVVYSPAADAPADLSGTDVTSSVRVGQGVDGQKIYPCTVVLALDFMSFTVEIDASITAIWPLGCAAWDFLLVYSGISKAPDTECFQILDNITKPT